MATCVVPLLMSCALAKAPSASPILSTLAANSAEPTVHSRTVSREPLMASANRLPAVAPFTIESVIESIPEDAPRPAFVAVCSSEDRLEFRVLMEAFPR